MNNKKWWEHLLAIPITLLIDIVVIVIALIIDGNIFSNSNGQGHGVPFVSFISFVVLGIITLIVFFSSVIKAIKSRRNKDEIIETNNQTSFKIYIQIIVSIVISIFITVISFSNEINNFYNDPNHIGFAIPVTSFMLVGILILVNIVVIIICVIVNKMRTKKNGKS